MQNAEVNELVNLNGWKQNQEELTSPVLDTLLLCNFNGISPPITA